MTRKEPVKRRVRVLMVEDSEDDALLVLHELKRGGFTVECRRVDTKETFVSALEKDPWDLILCDYSMPHFRGTHALEIVQKRRLDMPFIFVSGTIGEDIAVEAMKNGAHDYVMKGNLKRLLPAVVRELKDADERRARRVAENALHESEERYRQLAEAAHDIIFVVNREMVVEYANTFAGGLFGHKPEEMIGTKFTSWFPTQVHSRQLANIQRVLDTGESLYIEAPTGFAEGVRWLGTWLVPLKDGESVARAVLGISRDITEKKKSEEAIRQSEERYRLLSESSLMGVYLIQNDRFLYVNPTFCSVLGYTREELIDNIRPFDLVHPDDRRKAEEALVPVLAGDAQSFHLIVRDMRKDGASLFLDAFGTRTIYAGQPAIIGTFIDVTEQQKAAQALEEAYQKRAELEFIINKSPAVAFLWRAAEGWPVEYVSENISQFGYSVEDFVSGKILYASIVHKDDLERVGREVQQYTREGKPEFQQEYRILTKDGDVRWLDDRTWVRRNPDGTVSHYQGIVTDITLRREAERSLRESESRYREVVENATEIIFTTDKNGYFDYVNPAGQKLSGYSPEELRKLRFTDVVLEGHRNRIRSVYYRQFATQTENTFTECPFRTKDGRIVWLAQNTRLMHDRDGIRGFYVISRDITGRKEAEEALKQSEERLSAFLEATLDGVLVETKNRITYANKASALIYGYEDPSELIGKPIATLQLEEDVERLAEYAQKRERGEEAPTRYELQGKKKDGSLVDLELAVSLFRMGGKPHIISVIRDVSERKKIEKQILEQAALLDVASDAILVCDLDNVIRYWNKSAERIYGWQSQEVLGKNAELLQSSESGLPIGTVLGTVTAAGSWQGELLQTTREGRNIIVESRWTLMRESSGKPVSILIVNTDVTERKSFEAQLLRNQRLESLGTLAGGIAHDLNNVLAPILLSYDALKRQITDERTLRLATIAEESAKRGKEIVSQVLTFARGIEGAKGPIQTRHLFREVEHIIKETFPKSIVIEMILEKGLWPVIGDATQLHQVLMNLCLNARDAMPGGGKLSVTARNEYIDKAYAQMRVGAQQGPYVVLLVTDTGVGISRKNLDRIFDPFFTTKEPGKGTGLGLPTVHSIVKGHGGFIEVSSVEGAGTTFRVYLPATGTDQMESETVTSEFPKGNGELVLVVDDEASIRDITGETLRSFDYQVLTAKDGVEAVSQVAAYKNQISVIVMDLMMPNMDGVAAIQVIKRMVPDVRIVASSGVMQETGTPNLAVLGASGFLQKPYTAEKLLKMIHEVLEKNGGR